MRFDILKVITAALIVTTAMPNIAFAQTATPQPAPVRPQTPVKPYPYGEVEASYDNPARPGVHLAGTLTVPKGKGPFSAVLLIGGSGKRDRDSTLMGHKRFLLLSDYLTRRGIAVLRVDDRGVGGSTGEGPDDTSNDYATDVSAGVEWLKTRPEVDAKRIGLIGHSEGAVIAPLVAKANKSVAYAILCVGSSVIGTDLYVEQIRAVMASNGAAPEAVTAAANQTRALVKAVASAPDQETAYREAIKIAIADGKYTEAQVAPRMKLMSSAWFRNFLAYDPQPALRSMNIPVLALFGGKDVQVVATQNSPVTEAAFVGNPKAKVMVLPGLNHLLQTARSGSPQEYATINETISPTALKVMGDWLAEVAR